MIYDADCSHNSVARVTVTATGGYKEDHWQCSNCPMIFEPKRADAKHLEYIVKNTVQCCGDGGRLHTIRIDDPTETCMSCGHVGKPHSPISEAGYQEAVGKTEKIASTQGLPHPNDCPRAAKLERRIIDHYYSKSEIDARVQGMIDLQEWLDSSYKAEEFADKLQALRERFL